MNHYLRPIVKTFCLDEFEDAVEEYLSPSTVFIQILPCSRTKKFYFKSTKKVLNIRYNNIQQSQSNVFYSVITHFIEQNLGKNFIIGAPKEFGNTIIKFIQSIPKYSESITNN